MTAPSAGGAVVTGAGRGIGRAVAHRLAAAGSGVVVADLDLPAAVRTAADIRAAGGSATAIEVDVTSESAVVRALAECRQHYGTVSTVVANAGVADFRPFLATGLPDWRAVFSVNVDGTFHTLRQAAAVMVDQRTGGSLVAISSTNAFWMETDLSAYNASKAAVTGLVRSVALELAPYRIRANCVAPGLIRTEMSRGLTESAAGEAYLENIPLGTFGEPDDVAAAVAFLSSADARWLTGQMLVIDGGQTIGARLPAVD